MMIDDALSDHHGPVIFLFTLQREARSFGRVSDLLRIRLGLTPPCPVSGYKSAKTRYYVLFTGIGFERASRVARWVLEHLNPRLVVACGLAGALSPTLRVGDVLLASEVVEPGDDDLHWRTTVPIELGALPVGRLLTAPRMVATPADKRSLAGQTGAMMVDMEAAAIAEVCQEWQVPCAVVRAVSDTADTALSPRLVSLLSGSHVAPWRVLAAVARSPGLIPELWRLARDTRLAARSLATALHKLVS
jgi:adenosylhomocysteine nucleosidase